MSGPIKMMPVDSSNIRAIGYDAETKVVEVHFHNGGKLQYHRVPAEAHRALVSAKPSIGSYFSNVFLTSGYQSVKGPETK